VSRRIVVLGFAAAFALPATAAADWLLSPYVGLQFAPDTNLLVGFAGNDESKFTFGSSIGVLTDGMIGVEADIAFVPGFFESVSITQGSRIITVMGNVIVAAPLGATQYGLRPYFVGGAGLLHANGKSDFSLEDVIQSNVLGMNVGGGAIGPISPRSSLRFDVRYIRNLSSDDSQTFGGGRLKISFWRATAGLAFRF
jgi:hypothetical protein